MIKRFLVLLMIVSAVSLFAQVDRSKAPKAGPAPEINIGEYESFQLDNGLKVFVVENHKIPKVTFKLVLDRDPILEGKNAGYVSIAGDLLRTATKNRTKDQIDEEVDFIGASLSTSSDAVYGSTLTKHLEKFVEIYADVITNAVFKQEELDKVKKQRISGLKSEKDDPKAIARKVRNAIVYGKDHPYGEIETEETVNSVTLDMCKNYYETYFRPNIAYMAIVGDIDKDKAEELVKKYFASWEKKEVPAHTYKTPKAPIIRKVNLVDRSNSVQSVIQVGYPVDLKKGSKDVIPTYVMNTILGGNFSSRLNQNLREKHGWTYGAGSSISSDELVGEFVASCEARTPVTDSVVAEYIKEMQKMVSEKVTQEELQNTLNYLTGSFSRSLENPMTIANFALNTAMYKLDKDYYKNYLKTLNSVTADDIQRVAKKYVKPKKAHIVVVGNGSEIADKLKKFSPSGKINYYDENGEKYDPTAKKIPADLTAEKVIENYINAVGGKEKLSAIKDVKITMNGEIQGMKITITMMRKAPNKMKMDLDAGVMKQTTVFNGEKGRTSAMGQVKNFEGKELEEMKYSSMLNPELKYAELGFKLALTGMEKVNGKDAYKVEVTLPTGKKSVHYFDAETFYKVRETSTVDTPRGSFTQQTDMGDYKEVDGVKFPHKLTQQFGPQSIEMNVSEIKINSNIDDKEFEVK